MENFPHRAFWVAIGFATIFLLSAGGVLLSNLSYKNPVGLSLGAIGVVILLIKLWDNHRQSTQLLTSLQQLAQDELDVSSEESFGMHSLRVLHGKLHEAADFVEMLEETEAIGEFQHLSTDERLGMALINVKSTLRTYRENEEERHWAAQRLADFADILRGHSNDIEEFSNEVIRHLVKYLEVCQGGIFVKTEDEDRTWFALTACYAYDKKKYVEKQVAPGQGLVGQCALERKTILLTQVPDQYTTITSGLGETTPSTIVIVPLCWNEEIYGVIELASFTELASYQIAFLEKAAENIASSLATVQTNTHLHQLLETSQQLTQEFEQLSLVANNTDNSVIIADKHGRIEFVNHGFTKLTGYTADEVMGQKPGRVLQGPDTDPETVQRIHRKLREGTPFYEEILNYRKSGESYWISLTINPIKNEVGEIEQFISIQADVTQIKRQTLDYTYKLEAISRSNAIVEFDAQGVIVDANEVFLNVAGYHKDDLLGQSYQYLLPETEADSPQTQMMWDNLKAGTFFSGEFKQKNQAGKEMWLRGTFNPIFDLENNLRRIMMFAQFTTYEKKKQTELAGVVQAFSESVQTLEVTPEGKVKKGNALFLQRFGYQRRELSQMKLADLAEPNASVPDLKTALQQQDRFQASLALLTKSGDSVACQCSFTGIRDLEDKLSKVVVIVLETASEKALLSNPNA